MSATTTRDHEPARLTEARELVALQAEVDHELLSLTWALACLHGTQEQVDRCCPRGFKVPFVSILIPLRLVATGDAVLANWDEDEGALTRNSYAWEEL